MSEALTTSRSFADDMKKYLTGFGLSLIITLAAFGIVMFAGLDTLTTYIAIGLLAGAQVVVQSYYFLHIGGKEGSKLNASAYAFMIMTVVIVVLGSLWVMANLNYNMMHDMKEIEKEIIIDEGMHEKLDSRDHQH